MFNPKENPPSPIGPEGHEASTACPSSRRAQYSPRAVRPYSTRRPPYAARLAAILAHPETWPGRPGTSADGRHLTLWVLAGPDAWEVADLWGHPDAAPAPLFVLAPAEEAPAGFDWSVLRGHPPVLVRPCGDLSQGEVAALVGALVADGCERVLVLGDRGMRLFQAEGVRYAA
jgi:hypothetical protein